MKVKDLIEDLKMCDPELEVHLAYPYGDYNRSTVTAEVTEAEEKTVYYSEYHRAHKVYDDCREGSGKALYCVVLS